MAQLIKQGNIFGRIGTGFGKGLAEQLPKEIERNRLASGLRELGQKKDLTPFQQFAELSAIPGITPQTIQSGSELLKHQAQRNAYENIGKNNPSNSESDILNQVNFANINPNQVPKKATETFKEETPQGNFPSGEPQIVEKNPLSKELQTAIPWSPQQRDSEISKVWNQNPQLTFPQVSQIVSDNERRYLEAPEAYKAQQKELEVIQQKANDEIDKQLRKKLHIKAGEELFSKIPGETVNRIERGVSRDLRNNPDANQNDIINTWTDRALQNEKSKSEISKIANRPFDEKLFKKSETLDKLKSAAKGFKEFGNSEELYNIIKSDFGASPEGSASIAYELSKPADSYIKKIQPSNASNFIKNSIKYAHNLKEYMTRDDSILSIAKSIKEKDPFFEIKTFLEEARKIQDEIGFSDRQKLELQTRGVGDFFPNWGDIFLFPKFGRGSNE